MPQQLAGQRPRQRNVAPRSLRLQRRIAVRPLAVLHQVLAHRHRPGLQQVAVDAHMLRRQVQPLPPQAASLADPQARHRQQQQQHPVHRQLFHQRPHLLPVQLAALGRAQRRQLHELGGKVAVEIAHALGVPEDRVDRVANVLDRLPRQRLGLFLHQPLHVLGAHFAQPHMADRREHVIPQQAAVGARAPPQHDVGLEAQHHELAHRRHRLRVDRDTVQFVEYFLLSQPRRFPLRDRSRPLPPPNHPGELPPLDLAVHRPDVFPPSHPPRRAFLFRVRPLAALS